MFHCTSFIVFNLGMLNHIPRRIYCPKGIKSYQTVISFHENANHFHKKQGRCSTVLTLLEPYVPLHILGTWRGLDTTISHPFSFSCNTLLGCNLTIESIFVYAHKSQKPRIFGFSNTTSTKGKVYLGQNLHISHVSYNLLTLPYVDTSLVVNI